MSWSVDDDLNLRRVDERMNVTFISDTVASPAMGHLPPPRLPTVSFFVTLDFWSKSESQLSKYCVVCEISWRRCQQLTALSISTELVTKLHVLVIEQLLDPARKSTASAPWHYFQLCPSNKSWRRHCSDPSHITRFQFHIHRLIAHQRRRRQRGMGRLLYRTATKSTLVCFHSMQKGLGLGLGWRSDSVVFPGEWSAGSLGIVTEVTIQGRTLSVISKFARSSQNYS